MIWEPLMAVLTDVKTIYYSPSGLLHRINIGAIAIEEEENMASQFELIQLNSTRSLVVPSPLKELNNQVLLYGGIQYDSLAQIGLPTGERGATWSYLKGSEREVHNLEGLLKKNELEPTLLTGVAATEESFKGIGTFGATSPRVLHIATHGYFFPDPAKTTKAGEPVFKVSERPMLRSGLILAGGNHTWMNTQPNKTAEDGILTALEISQMNLRNTELVVLSACETGLGEIQGNEGVYGLQRAFKIAGAKYIIMSLWQVPDKQTSNLMLRFYSKWLEDQMSIRAAFASAQQEMSEMGFDPYFWAGFVLVE
jgi:CHAT domain-containing protein